MKLCLLITLIFSISFSNSLFAQDGTGGGGGVENFVADSKGDLLIVIAGGLAGAVLGLSTLSFVDKPRLHTRNIVVGASFGIIAGVIFVAMNQAERSRQMFAPSEEEEEYSLRLDSSNGHTLNRLSWHNDTIDRNYRQTTTLGPFIMSWTTSF